MHIQKNEDGSIFLTAPVMIPGEPDCDFNRGEPPLTEEQIRNFAKSFQNYRFIDNEHEFTRSGRKRGELKDSFLLNNSTTFELYDGSIKTYPKGTWMMCSHVTDDEAIKTALNGGYTGYSPSVRSREVADKYKELILTHDYDAADKAFSQSGLIKDVPDPVVLCVSLVEKPCQTGNKFCKLKKTKDGIMAEDNIKSKVLDALGMSDAADVEALKSQVSSFEAKLEELKKDHNEALKSMKEELLTEVTDLFKEAFADKSAKDDDETDDEEDSEETTKDEPKKDTSDNSSDDDETDDEKKKKADKSGSKQGKNHNNMSDKSQEMDTYSFLGRKPDGTAKR